MTPTPAAVPTVPASRALELTLADAIVAAAAAIPADVRQHARVLVADSVAISLAASRVSPVARAAADAALAGCDAGSSHVYGTTRTAPPAVAAFANSAFAHALDFDDTHDLARLHTTTVVLPAALAVGQLCDADGERVLDAVVLGAELMCRLGLAADPTATSPAASWFLTQLTGYVGAAVAAAFTLGLDSAGIASAIGFGYAQAAGAKQAALVNGSQARSIYPAFAAAGGVTAALLARSGLRGPVDALDGPAGLWPAYLGTGLEPAAEASLLDLGGERWEFREIAVKSWPTCRLAHPYLDAVASLPVIDAPIEAVTLAVNASVARLCRPVTDRRRPATLADAGFSVPYITAAALARGGFGLTDLEPGLLSDERVHAIVDVTAFEDRLPDGLGNPPGEVTVRAGGEVFTARGRAHPAPDDAEVRAKGVRCLTEALPGRDPDELLTMLDGFADGSVRDLMRSITRWSAGEARSRR